MSEEFLNKVTQLEELYDKLMGCPLITVNEAIGSKVFPNSGGVYVFFEGNKALYVGRSSKLKARLRMHKGGDHMAASLAFKLSKEVAKSVNLDLSKCKNKKMIASIPEFQKIFCDSKDRIAKMLVRHVPLEDDITQLIFEPYVHLKLRTPYNDFKNH